MRSATGASENLFPLFRIMLVCRASLRNLKNRVPEA